MKLHSRSILLLVLITLLLSVAIAQAQAPDLPPDTDVILHVTSDIGDPLSGTIKVGLCDSMQYGGSIPSTSPGIFHVNLGSYGCYHAQGTLMADDDPQFYNLSQNFWYREDVATPWSEQLVAAADATRRIWLPLVHK